MKKKLKILTIILLAIIVLWGGIFTVDFFRCANLKMPIFVIPGETFDDGGSSTYYGLGYVVKIKKHISAEYGVQMESVEMYVLNKCISGAIACF